MEVVKKKSTIKIEDRDVGKLFFFFALNLSVCWNSVFFPPHPVQYSVAGFLSGGSLIKHGRSSLVGFGPSAGWDLIGCS